jgi:hypothetical protein
VLTVNDQPLKGLDLEQALKLLRTNESTVKLMVARSINSFDVCSSATSGVAYETTASTDARHSRLARAQSLIESNRSIPRVGALKTSILKQQRKLSATSNQTSNLEPSVGQAREEAVLRPEVIQPLETTFTAHSQLGTSVDPYSSLKYSASLRRSSPFASSPSSALPNHSSPQPNISHSMVSTQPLLTNLNHDTHHPLLKRKARQMQVINHRHSTGDTFVVHLSVVSKCDSFVRLDLQNFCFCIVGSRHNTLRIQSFAFPFQI